MSPGVAGAPTPLPPTPWPPGPETVQSRRVIVEACDRFEAEWRAGRSPRIDRVVASVPAALRPEVGRTLEILQQELREEAGPDIDAPPGTVSPIEVLRPLAAGGMGQVSVAYDCEVNRLVALKEILPQGLENGELRQRFLREAQITGRMEHPGIIPVYSRGRHADGRPYYTMRLISGEQSGTLQQALQRYHQQPPGERRERDLVWRQLVRRLIDVCNTMAYVHSRGVLHRDLKPSNILLGPYGETLVVDWGLARELGASPETSPELDGRAPTERGEPPTASGVAPASTATGSDPTRWNPVRGTNSGSGQGTAPGPGSDAQPVSTPPRSTHGVGTPGYASPEQLMGDRGPLTPASDVYSLGATLYATLTGRSAFPSHAGIDAAELLRRICVGEYPTPRSVNPRIEPALEAICLKAMAVDPGQRYRSCSQMAADLECHLAGEPVSAWSEPWTDRLRRWLARHRTGVLLGSVGLVLSTLFLLVLAVVQTRGQQALLAEGVRLAEAKRRAEHNEQLAVDAVRRFGALVARDPQLRYSRELQPLRRELLREPIAYLRQLRDELRQGAEPQASRLWQLRETTRQVAELHREIGDLGEARQLLADELQLCAEGLVAPPDSGGPTAFDWRVAEARAHLTLTQILRQSGRPQAQLEEAEAAIAALVPLQGQFPHTAELVGDLASARGAQGAALAALYRLPESIDSYREAIEAARVCVQRLPGEFDRRRDLAELLQELTAVLNQAERLPEARLTSDESEGLLRELDGLFPNDPLARQQRAIAHLQRGLQLTRDQRYDEGVEELRRAERGWRQLLQDFPARNEYAGQLRLVLLNLGNLLVAANQANAALPVFSELVDRERENLAQSPGVSEFHGNLGSALHQLGHVLQRLGRKDEVRGTYLEAAGFVERAYSEFPEVLRWRLMMFELQTHLSDIDSESGRLVEARDRVQQMVPLALAISEAPDALEGDRGRVLPALRALAALHELTDQLTEAEETRQLLRPLEARDAFLRRIDARLEQIAGGAIPVSQDERVGIARRASEITRYDLAARLASEALDLEPALQSHRGYQVGLLAAATATAAAAQLDDPRQPQGVAWRRQARVWLRQELEFWRGAPAELRAELIAGVSGWFTDHRFASVRIPRRLAELPVEEQAEWQEIWESATRLIKQSNR